MRILLNLYSYGKVTGSELYVYELARELLALGHHVGIASISTDMDSELVGRLQHENLEYYQLCDIKDEWDIVHSSQTQSTEMVKLLVTCPIIQTIHSEVLEKYESPVDGLSHYVAIRKTIYDNLVKKYGKERVSLIYNGVDPKRFHPFGKLSRAIAFPGTVNYLRSKAFQDAARYMEDGYEIYYVGEGWENKTVGMTHFMKPIWNIESVYKKCSMTASIMLGRTTIEGWMCGLPGIIYTIDDKGGIVRKTIKYPPSDIDRYRSDNVAKELVKLYERYAGRHIHSNVRES